VGPCDLPAGPSEILRDPLGIQKGRQAGTAGADFRSGRPTALIITTAAGLERQARQEVRQLLAGAEARSLFLKGNLLALTDLPEEEAVARLAQAETELVGRVTPVQVSVALTVDSGCFPQVAAAAAEIGRIEAGQLFLVRCHRRGHHEWTGRELEKSVALLLQEATGGVGEYEKSVSWVMSAEVFQGVGYVGVNRPHQLLQKTLQRQRKYAPGERPLNRAQLKLEEALAAFGINLPDGARVLDLGSAPGGWALALAELGCRVVAVDPADLDPKVAGHPHVEHLRARAEDLPAEFFSEGGSPGEGGVAKAGAAAREGWREAFDLMTCDMNIDPREAAEVMCRLAGVLKRGAPAIMTVKYMTRERRRHQHEARETLVQQYEGIAMRRMPHNALETTAVMSRRGGAEVIPK